MYSACNDNAIMVASVLVQPILSLHIRIQKHYMKGPPYLLCENDTLLGNTLECSPEFS